MLDVEGRLEKDQPTGTDTSLSAVLRFPKIAEGMLQYQEKHEMLKPKK